VITLPVAVPLAVPRHFRLDPDRPVTSSTADFLWNAVDPESILMNGFFTGYKVIILGLHNDTSRV